MQAVQVVTIVVVGILLNSCHKLKRSAGHAGSSKPILTASPNPVPAGNPEQPLGTTVVTWDTGQDAVGALYVKVNRDRETLVTRAPRGKQEIPWIQFDSLYEFRLYDNKHSKLLAKVQVSRDN